MKIYKIINDDKCKRILVRDCLQLDDTPITDEFILTIGKNTFTLADIRKYADEKDDLTKIPMFEVMALFAYIDRKIKTYKYAHKGIVKSALDNRYQNYMAKEIRKLIDCYN